MAIVSAVGTARGQGFRRPSTTLGLAAISAPVAIGPVANSGVGAALQFSAGVGASAGTGFAAAIWGQIMAGFLAGVLYDPAVAVTKSGTAATAMAAFDTTNARVTFTVPPSGRVMVRIAITCHGGTNSNQAFLGILQSSTVIARSPATISIKQISTGSPMYALESVFVVGGLTPGASLTWDAAYGIEFVVGAGGLKYGGPDDATADNAFGALIFTVYDATACLASILYDPTTAGSKATATLQAMTAIDTTNLRTTFTVPTTGRVGVRIRCVVSGSTVFPTVLLGVLEGSTIRGRVNPQGNWQSGAVAASTWSIHDAFYVFTGLTPGASLTWDAAVSVETAAASTAIRWGGPNNTTANDAFGGIQFEIWDVGG